MKFFYVCDTRHMWGPRDEREVHRGVREPMHKGAQQQASRPTADEAADNETGWQMALGKLAALVEADPINQISC